MATDLVRSNYIASLSRRNSPLSYAQSRNLISQILADIFLAGGSGGGGGGGGGGDASAANQLVANTILAAIETAVSGTLTVTNPSLSDLNTRAGTTGDPANPAGTESAQLRAIGERLRVSAYSLGETSTANPGTTWTPLASGAATAITIRNRTSTSIDVRIAGGGAALTLENSEDVALPVLNNSSEWEVRRSDTSNTPVSIQFLRYTA
jgi:hypothetical protein